jgi:hypothetical protein
MGVGRRLFRPERFLHFPVRKCFLRRLFATQFSTWGCHPRSVREAGREQQADAIYQVPEWELPFPGFSSAPTKIAVADASRSSRNDLGKT